MSGVALLALLAVPLLAAESTPKKAKKAKQDVEWTMLFDGGATNAFRGYKQTGLPSSWKVEDGALKTIPGKGGDLVTREKYDNFELRLQWKIAAGGNSGIMYRVSEDFDEPWWTGPEMQVLDDAKHADGKDPRTSAGALYALLAPKEKKLRPVGEWNRVRLVVQGNHVEHWLNGDKILSYELGSPELNALIAKSKFADKPRFGKETTGHICLQHHNDEVWYRNVRVRKLPAK